jgi:hypothetical protein
MKHLTPHYILFVLLVWCLPSLQAQQTEILDGPTFWQKAYQHIRQAQKITLIEIDTRSEADPANPTGISWMLHLISSEGDSLYYIDADGKAALLEIEDGRTSQFSTPAEGEGSLEFRGDSIGLPDGQLMKLPSSTSTLSLEGTILQLSNGNSVDLGQIIPWECCSDHQTLRLDGTVLSISNGNALDLRNIVQDIYPITSPTPPPAEEPLLPPLLSEGNKNLTDSLDQLLSELEGVALVKDYDELRNAPPQQAKIALVTDPGIDGLFYQVEKGEEDGGTMIVSVLDDSTSFYWKRLHPEGFYKLSWWPIGGYTPISQVDHVIRTGSDIFQTILETTQQRGLHIDVSSDESPRTIWMDRPVRLQRNVTVTGNGDTFKRTDAAWTTLTAAAGGDDSELQVADTTGFRIGHEVLITKGRADGQNNGYIRRIKALGEGKITLNETIKEPMSTGDTVVTVSTLFVNGAADFTLDRIQFYNVNFDGNWSGNPFINQWNVNNTINFPSAMTTTLIVEKSWVKNMPSENFLAGNAILRDIKADSLAGSLYHVALSLDPSLGVYIENVFARDVNLATNAVTGHSEAFILTSAQATNVKILDVKAYNGREAFFGDLGPSARNWEIRNCRVENFPYATLSSTASGKLEGLKVEGNTFVNCNVFRFFNGNLLNGQYVKDALIQNNKFINTALEMRGSSGLKIINNEFLYRPERGGFRNLATIGGQLKSDAMIYLAEFEHLELNGNILEGDPQVNDTLSCGIVLDNINTLDPSISAEFYLGYGMDCSGNHLRDFRRSISYEPRSTYDLLNFDFRGRRSYHDWQIHRNTIRMQQGAAGESWGILAGPGVKVHYNQIYTANDTISGSSFPIFGYGVQKNPTNSIVKKLVGADIQFNQIWGLSKADNSTFSILAGGGLSGSPYSSHNCIVQFNTIMTPVQGNALDPDPETGQTTSIIQHNTVIKEQLPLFSDPAVPPSVDF